MDASDRTPFEAFVPVLAWPGRRPGLGELASWHEALSDALAVLLPFDLMACWLYPSRGGSVLVGPPGLVEDRVVPPAAEPLVSQEGLFALEDRVRAAGYRSVTAVPIRSEVQDVGLLLVASFEADVYRLAHLRLLHRVAGELSGSCRRLASHLWLPTAPGTDDPNAALLGLTDRLLDAGHRARDGADLVQLASDAVAAELPHERLDLVAVVPAPECSALLATRQGTAARSVRQDPDGIRCIDALVDRMGARDLVRIPDLRQIGLAWPSAGDPRGADRLRALLAVRLEVGGEIVGWLWLGSETPGWFREEDESVARHAARLLAAHVAGWVARTEQAGAWS